MSRIERVRARCVGPPVERHTWSHDLPPQFMTCIIVQVSTDDGQEGSGRCGTRPSFDFDRYTAEAMRHLLPLLVGKDPLGREAILHEMRPRVFPLPAGRLPPSRSRSSTLPRRMRASPSTGSSAAPATASPAYASPPLLASVPAYLDFVAECVEGGFRAIKFHTWCDLARDLELARAVRREHPGSGMDFMLDVENNYTREEAMRAGRELADLGFRWFEAPLPDHDLEGYRALTSELSIPILRPATGSRTSRSLARRSDPDLGRRAHRRHHDGRHRPGPGGRGPRAIRGARLRDHVLGLLTSPRAANFHLMLALDNCTFFEQAMPYEAFRVRDGRRDPPPDRTASSPPPSVPASACGWTGRRWRRPPSMRWKHRKPEPPGRARAGSRPGGDSKSVWSLAVLHPDSLPEPEVPLRPRFPAARPAARKRYDTVRAATRHGETLMARRVIHDFVIPARTGPRRRGDEGPGPSHPPRPRTGRSVTAQFFNLHDRREAFHVGQSWALNVMLGHGNGKSFKYFYSKPPRENVMLEVGRGYGWRALVEHGRAVQPAAARAAGRG